MCAKVASNPVTLNWIISFFYVDVQFYISVEEGVSLMIPGRMTCTNGWNKEYAGYLMGGATSHKRSEWICVDEAPGKSAICNQSMHWHNPGHTHQCNLVLSVTQTPSHGTNVTTLVNVTDVPTLTRSPTIVVCPNVICSTATTKD